MSTTTITAADNAASVASKFAAAGQGGTVQVADGVNVDLGATVLSLLPGMKVVGNYGKNVIRWTGLGGNNGHGMRCVVNAANVTLDGLELNSNQGVLRATEGATNFNLIGCGLSAKAWTFPNSTQMGFGIWGVGMAGLSMTYNRFHDTAAGRLHETWAGDNRKIDHNLYESVLDGGHFMEPGANCSFSYNYATRLTRMMQEIQGDSVGLNLLVEGNVAYGWQNPYWDSFGVSVENHNSLNTQVLQNYFGMTMAAGGEWGPKDNGGTQRMGYCIEIGGANGTPLVQGNTCVMQLTTAAGVNTSRTATARGNKMYGSAQWGIFATEPGPDGQGKYANNTQTDNTFGAVADAPPPPANTFAGPQFRSGIASGPIVIDTPVVIPPIAAPASIADLTATVIGDNSVKLAWATPLPVAGAVAVVSTGNNATMATVTIPAGAMTTTLLGLHSGWNLAFQITAGSAKSDSKTVLMTGSSTATQPAVNVNSGVVAIS